MKTFKEVEVKSAREKSKLKEEDANKLIRHLEQVVEAGLQESVIKTILESDYKSQKSEFLKELTGYRLNKKAKLVSADSITKKNPEYDPE